MSDDQLDGHRFALAIIVMVTATIKAGNFPVKVKMNPLDFRDLRHEDGSEWAELEIAGLPIELDAGVQPGKIFALNAQADR